MFEARRLRGETASGAAAGDAARQHSVDKQVAQAKGFAALRLPGHAIRGVGSWPLISEVFEGAAPPNPEGLRINEATGLEVFPASFRWTAFVQGDGQQFEDAVTIAPWELSRGQGNALAAALRPPGSLRQHCSQPWRAVRKSQWSSAYYRIGNSSL